jgi:hypothetical protein
MVASIIPYTIHTLCTQIIVVVVIVGASVGVAAGAGDSRGNRLLDCSAVVVSILGSVRLPYIHTYIHTYLHTYTFVGRRCEVRAHHPDLTVHRDRLFLEELGRIPTLWRTPVRTWHGYRRGRLSAGHSDGRSGNGRRRTSWGCRSDSEYPDHLVGSMGHGQRLAIRKTHSSDRQVMYVLYVMYVCMYVCKRFLFVRVTVPVVLFACVALFIGKL